MPNWCQNTLLIRSVREEDVNDLIKIFESKEPFEAIRPQPEDLMRFTDSAWYNWRLSNWGCKWDTKDALIHHFPETETTLAAARIEFETPWGPPNGIFTQLVNDYPCCQFELIYNEPSMCIRGTYSSDDLRADLIDIS